MLYNRAHEWKFLYTQYNTPPHVYIVYGVPYPHNIMFSSCEIWFGKSNRKILFDSSRLFFKGILSVYTRQNRRRKNLSNHIQLIASYLNDSLYTHIYIYV